MFNTFLRLETACLYDIWRETTDNVFCIGLALHKEQVSG